MYVAKLTLALVLILFSLKVVAYDADALENKDLQELDIKMYKNIKTGKIVVLGFVSKIIDGDTIVIEDFFKIRMYGIDAPEKRQKCQDKKGNEYACGLEAIANLTKLIGKKRINCVHHTSDKYGRFVFQCKNAQGIDVNQAMVQYLMTCLIRLCTIFRTSIG